MKNTKMAIVVGMALVIFLAGCNAANQGKIKVGAILPLTGSSSIWGENEQKGISLALEDLKAQGIENVEVITEDSQSKDAPAVTAAQKLISLDDVDLIYTSLTGPSIAVAPVANSSGKLHLYKAATQVPINNFPENSLKTGYYNYEIDCSVFGELLAKNNYKKIAYVAAKKDFSTECKRGIANSAPSVAIDEYSYEVSNEDFMSILTKIRESEYDAIVITGYNADFLKFYSKMSQLKINTTVLCAGSEDCLSENPDLMPLGMVYFGAYIDNNFKEKLLAKYANMSILEQSIAATSYDMVRFVSEAYSVCPSRQRECLKKAIQDSKLDTAIDSEGFQGGSFLKLKVRLFEVNETKGVIELK